ncbi:hypothetical protein [Escherichia coli]|uniref:hypothetical protein n=5 Tax=Escherichia coli TaxID=562 RepID=UPI00058A16D7|nr:hypothetical protein [Escherichia coli]EFA8566406.1 hypothetical protein [Escherichia coli O157]EEV5626722.1 hypothetical protein [Escherichia coli]EEV6025330.1 hypothetical protein [Escherichia coli]EEV6991638.1 hypothetical protein [Escherichia coli]EEY3544234.1 hypothetical protein [Escherichia coli]
MCDKTMKRRDNTALYQDDCEALLLWMKFREDKYGEVLFRVIDIAYGLDMSVRQCCICLSFLYEAGLVDYDENNNRLSRQWFLV